MMRVLSVFGTRPEAIKMAPVVKALEGDSYFESAVCVTGQHKLMLNSALDLFGIAPKFSLNVMTENQTLVGLSAKIMAGLCPVLAEYRPDMVLVHGDTTTTFIATLSAFYSGIKVGHVEAGLRSGDITSPWPEEANRRLTGLLTTLHFAPTARARENLLEEKVPEHNITVTGNTVIDALHLAVGQLDRGNETERALKTKFPFLASSGRMILVTGHRRESFGAGFVNICDALVTIARRWPDTIIVYPVHLNPNVQEPVRTRLAGIANIHLIAPQDYLPFVCLMRRSHLILTDSGGIQEEGPSLGKPVLVMRDTTERGEAISAGTVKLVTTNAEKIVSSVEELLDNEVSYNAMVRAVNPYGDGQAAKRIVDFLKQSNF